MPTGKLPKERVAIITNLYPVTWAPNRASFNKQQFDFLAEVADTSIFIFIPWIEWLKHRKQPKLTKNTSYLPYFYIPRVGRWLTPFFQLISLLLASHRIKRFNPDSIIASWAFPDAVAVAMFCRLFNLPFVVKAHGTDVNENLHRPARRWLMRKWLSSSKHVFCASRALENKFELAGFDKCQLSTNYNGVDKTVFYPSRSTQKRATIKLIFVGTLIPTKGVEELYESFKQIKDNFNCSLNFVGAGNLSKKLERQIQEDGLSSRVQLSGSLGLAQVAEEIRQSDLLVLPSYREGVPNVLLEAFASGVPVVATRVGGIPEVVKPNTGILVDAKDVDSLAEGLSEALNREWCRKDILEHAELFDWRANLRNLMSNMTKLK